MALFLVGAGVVGLYKLGRLVIRHVEEERQKQRPQQTGNNTSTRTRPRNVQREHSEGQAEVLRVSVTKATRHPTDGDESDSTKKKCAGSPDLGRATTDGCRSIIPNQKVRTSKPKHTEKESIMQVPANNIGIWKLGESNAFTSVPKTWAVSNCIAHVRNNLGCGNGDVDLWNHNRCILLDKQKSLSGYPGLTKLHVIRRPQSRNPVVGYATSLPDLMDPYEDETRVKMSCGHAITPENLFSYAWSKVSNGVIDILCPAVPNMRKPAEQCSKPWDFKEVSLLACLSDDEHNLFLAKLFSNWLEKNSNVHICPRCDAAQESGYKACITCMNCSYSFCCKCFDYVPVRECVNSECRQSIQKIRDLLQNRPMRTIVGIPHCPSIRACPVCQYVIEFGEEDSCKHMTCPRNTCRAQFCFICLKIKTDKYYWPCGGAFERCKPAPIQRI